MFLNSQVRKGEYALKHNKDQNEHEYDKSYHECTHKPVINQYSDENPCVWRQESDKQIYGVEKFLARTQAGR